MAKSKRGYLEPKVSDPDLIRKHKNGQAINPPSYMEMGGFTDSSKLKGEKGIMSLQDGPKAQRGKPL